MFTKKRPDGTYLRNIHFLTQLMPYLMPTKASAAIYFEQEFDVTKTLEYVRRKKAESGGPKITLFNIIMYAGIRVIAQRPKMNRFVSGYRYYQRNRISYNFIAKRDLTDEGEEVTVTMSFSPFLSLEGFSKKINDYISSLKKGASTSTEKLNSFVAHLPRTCIKFFVRLVMFLDYHNALPKAAIDSLPFFTTIFFANVGSVGIDAPFHHTFEIGNCGIFGVLGKIREEYCLNADGSVERRNKVKITFTFDDRITDGIYSARTFDMLKDLVENPEKLEAPLELTAEQLSSLGLAESELQV